MKHKNVSNFTMKTLHRNIKKRVRIRNINYIQLILTNAVSLIALATASIYISGYSYNFFYFHLYNIQIAQIPLTIQDTFFASYLYVFILIPMITAFLPLYFLNASNNTEYNVDVKAFIVFTIMGTLLISTGIYFGINKSVFNIFNSNILGLVLGSIILVTGLMFINFRIFLYISSIIIFVVIIPFFSLIYYIQLANTHNVSYITFNDEVYHLQRTFEKGFLVISNNNELHFIFKDANNSINFGIHNKLIEFIELNKNTKINSEDRT